jgi:hypothetical protein
MTANVMTPSMGTKSVVLGIHRGDKCLYQFELLEGKSVIAGSDKNCGIHLDGGLVAPIHALFHLINGTLLVRNWGSQSRTQVDGAVIDGQAEIGEHSVVTLGEYVIKVISSEGAPGSRETNRRNPFEHREPPKSVAAAVEVKEPGGSDRSDGLDVPVSPNVSDLADPSVSSDPTDTAQGAERPDVSERPKRLEEPDGPEGPEGRDKSDGSHDSKESHVSHVSESLDSTEPDDFTDYPDLPDDHSVWSALTQSATDDVFGQETVELLRLEVEQLQRDVAERDARLAAFSASDASRPAEDPTREHETEKLVERLEQLLDELGAKDERITALEDLLSAAEQVRGAETEERRQLENWLKDIEERMSQRNGERDAETERLRQRLRENTATRTRLEQQLRSLQPTRPIPAPKSVKN